MDTQNILKLYIKNGISREAQISNKYRSKWNDQSKDAKRCWRCECVFLRLCNFFCLHICVAFLHIFFVFLHIFAHFYKCLHIFFIFCVLLHSFCMHFVCYFLKFKFLFMQVFKYFATLDQCLIIV